MAQPATKLARAWLLKAFSDLDTARQIGGLTEGHLDAGIYHCQQAAEKALKGFWFCTANLSKEFTTSAKSLSRSSS